MRKTLAITSAISIVIAVTAALAFVRLPSANSIRTALSSTTIDHIAFREAPAAEPVAAILDAVRQQHPHVRRLRVVTHKFNTINGVADPLNHLPVTFDFHQIPADKALEYLYDAALVGYAVRHGSIHFFVPTFRDNTATAPPLTFSEKIIKHSNRICEAIYQNLYGVFHR